MKKRINFLILALITAIALISYVLFSSNLNIINKNESKEVRIAIFSIVEIAPITQLRKGFEETMVNSVFATKHKLIITHENAQGDAALTNQIADKIVTSKPDLVYVLGTPAAQAVQKRSPQTLLVQGAVTDPVSAGLANSWQASGKKYIATSDLPPIDKQVDLIRKLTPNLSKLGLIYNPGESNSVAVISRLRKYIDEQKITWKLVEHSIANSSDVARAVQTFAGNVDAIYIPPDNTAATAIPVIGKIAKDIKVPFYTTVQDAIKQGALATLSLDFHELGKESAELAISVLDGKNPSTIPIKISDNPIVTINSKVAKEYSLDISYFKDQKNVKISD